MTAPDFVPHTPGHLSDMPTFRPRMPPEPLAATFNR